MIRLGDYEILPADYNGIRQNKQASLQSPPLPLPSSDRSIQDRVWSSPLRRVDRGCSARLVRRSRPLIFFWLL